jgi:sortase A
LVPAPPGQGFEFGTLRSEATGATTGSTVGAQFEPVDWSELPFSIGGRPRAQRMIIPAIGLDSSIVELGTTWDGPNLQWETADNAVGHHLGTPNPAELGNSVFSGHINSPFRGEGSIFRRLPEVAALLREGRTIDIILESGGGRYLYRATSTDVLVPEEVDVFRPDRTPSLTLVTCVPATHYTHRFLVNAVLVGYAPV